MSGTLLIVDDDPYIRDALVELLTDEGYDVRAASNGREALTMIANERPCLVLLDLMMPVMDGLTFLRHVRASIPDRAIQVVLMTAAPARIPARVGLPVVTKPIEIHALLDLVRRHCQPEARVDDAPMTAKRANDDPDGFDCRRA
jgi:CheY-like chemotaxis protein